MDNYEDRRCKVPILGFTNTFLSKKFIKFSLPVCCSTRNLSWKGAKTNSKFLVPRERSKVEEDNEITRRVNVQPDRGQRGTHSRDMCAHVCVSVPHVFPYIFAPVGKKTQQTVFLNF